MSRIALSLLSSFVCTSLLGCNLPQAVFLGDEGEPDLRDLAMPTPTSQAYESSLSDDKADNILYYEDFEGTEISEIMIENFDYSSGQAQQIRDFLWQVSTDPWMPIHGHSHPTAVITTPFGPYPDYAYGYVLLPPIDLTNVSQAVLRFNIFFDIEDYFDGLLISASVDQGVTWEQLMPAQGYTGTVYVFENSHGFSGLLNDWWSIAVDLSHLIGHFVLIAFEFGSDGSVGYDGAAIDDIIITASSPPDSEPSDLGAVPGYTPPVWQPSYPATIEDPDIRWATAESLVNCREGTNQAFPIVATLRSGQAVPVKAINPNGSWFYVFDPEDQVSCWAWSDLMDGPETLEGLAILPDALPPESESVEQPGDGGDGTPICSDTLPAPECVAAGGTPQTNAWPPCICP